MYSLGLANMLIFQRGEFCFFFSMGLSCLFHLKEEKAFIHKFTFSSDLQTGFLAMVFLGDGYNDAANFLLGYTLDMEINCLNFALL